MQTIQTGSKLNLQFPVYQADPITGQKLTDPNTGVPLPFDCTGFATLQVVALSPNGTATTYTPANGVALVTSPNVVQLPVTKTMMTVAGVWSLQVIGLDGQGNPTKSAQAQINAQAALA